MWDEYCSSLSTQLRNASAHSVPRCIVSSALDFELTLNVKKVSTIDLVAIKTLLNDDKKCRTEYLFTCLGMQPIPLGRTNFSYTKGVSKRDVTLLRNYRTSCFSDWGRISDFPLYRYQIKGLQPSTEIYRLPEGESRASEIKQLYSWRSTKIHFCVFTCRSWGNSIHYRFNN